MNVGVQPVEVKEIVYQAIPMSAWQGLRLNATNDVLTEAVSSCHWKASRRPPPKAGPRKDWRSRRRLSVVSGSSKCTLHG